MGRVIRSAMLQMRVTPGIKHASEEVLGRIGLSMTEAMELFLRRMILDQRIPFEITALDGATLARIEQEWSDMKKTKPRDREGPKRKPSRVGREGARR